MTVKKGDKVKVHYTGTFDDGSVFDSSEGKDPIEVHVGQGQVIPGFEQALEGMAKDDEKDIKLTSAEAYGEQNEQLVQKLPKDMFAQAPDQVQVGAQIVLQSPDGQKIPAIIKEVADDGVTVDMNHPLAGKNLNFKLKVVDIQE